MKRASDVPPVVDKAGLSPVSAATASATSVVKGPGSVTKGKRVARLEREIEGRYSPAASKRRANSSRNPRASTGR